MDGGSLFGIVALVVIGYTVNLACFAYIADEGPTLLWFRLAFAVSVMVPFLAAPMALLYWAVME